MFQDNSSKCSLELDSERNNQLGQSQEPNRVMIKDPSQTINLLPKDYQNNQAEIYNDPLDLFEEPNDEEEMNGNNTKPCLTNKDFQSIPDLNQVLDQDLPQIPIIKAEKLEKEANKDIMEEQKETRLQVQIPAIVLDSPSKMTVAREKKSDHTESLLKMAKKTEEKKGKSKESFDWNNFLVRRA